MPQLNENSPRYPVPAKDSVYRNNYLLSKQFIENRDESQPTAYILEVREDYTPLLSVNKSFFQPWVVIQDKYKKENAVRIPVTVCDTLLQHILTSFKSKNEHSDFDGNGVTNEFSNQAYKGPGCAFGDGTNTDLQDCDAHQLKKNKENLSKAFSMEYLSPIRIVCDTTGCVIEISSRDPMIRAFDNKEETVQENSSTNPVRRWIVSSLVENINSLNSEQVSSNNEERKRPLESRGSVEIHKNLLPQLSAFLSDVVVRFRPIIKPSQVQPLYSTSGNRMFYFDLRDTRWGRRLQISQLTDMHRSTIGVPLEALVNFRSRLDKLIECLSLNESHALKSTLCKDIEDKQPRGRFTTGFKNFTNYNDNSGGRLINDKRQIVNKPYFRPQTPFIRRVHNKFVNNAYPARQNTPYQRRYWYPNQPRFVDERQFINKPYQNHKISSKQKAEKRRSNPQAITTNSTVKENNDVIAENKAPT